jgi:two-component system, sensor histidine kinase
VTASVLPIPEVAPLHGTVLVVDDDLGLQGTICDILRMTGIDATGVGSASEATRWFDEHNPDLVLLDQRLPDSSGLQLAALLKARTPLVPVVLVTGYVSTDTAIAAVGLVDDFLTKPVPPNELVKVVQTRLEQHRLMVANHDLLSQLKQTNSNLEHTVETRTRELSAARDEALEASRLKSQFLANMSHEIRTPMAGVIGAGELLATTDLTSEQRGYCDIIRRSGQALLGVITDILDFSKIEAGRLDLAASTFSLLEPFADVVEMLAPQASAKGLRLRLDADPALPRLVEGDVGRLRQIITNLVGNAVKFTDAGHVVVTVEVSHESPGTVTIRCSVADTGIGIAEQDVPRLFNDFTQVDTSDTRRFGGTGLGLVISDRLVRLMDGEIGCSPNADGGTTFTFTVTFVVPPLLTLGTGADATALAGSPATDVNTASAQGPLILIVEDNEVNALILGRMLTLLGYCSETVTSGTDALQAVAHATYAAILMDCQMPVMDGFTTTRRMRALPAGDARVPIVAITATANTEDEKRCLDAGMDDYLPKPIIMDRLAAVLNHWAPLPTDLTAAAEATGTQ